MSTELSIDQLVDLKIAITKREQENKELNETHTFLTSENQRLDENNRRLTSDLDIQAERIGSAKAENEKLILEKQGILSQFAVDNEIVYKDLREQQEKVSGDLQLLTLRSIEVEKREAGLANIEQKNLNILNGVEKIEQITKTEVIKNETLLLEIESSKKELEVKDKQIDQKNIDLQDKITNVEIIKDELAEKENNLLKTIQENTTILSELQYTKQLNESNIGRLERLNTLFIELKDIIAKNGTYTVEEIEQIVNDKILGNTVTNETQKKIVVVKDTDNLLKQNIQPVLEPTEDLNTDNDEVIDEEENTTEKMHKLLFDYNSLTFKELKILAEEKEIIVRVGTSRIQLIELLTN